MDSGVQFCERGRSQDAVSRPLWGAVGSGYCNVAVNGTLAFENAADPTIAVVVVVPVTVIERPGCVWRTRFVAPPGGVIWPVTGPEYDMHCQVGSRAVCTDWQSTGPSVHVQDPVTAIGPP